MDKPVLTDEKEYPDDGILKRSLGEAKEAWNSFMDLLKESFPLFVGEWRYYKDGKSWLFKIVKKKKTICWVSVYHGRFKTTFYFSDKAEALVAKSPLNADLKNQFKNGKRYGKIRGITVDIKKTSDLDATIILIEIKEKLT